MIVNLIFWVIVLVSLIGTSIYYLGEVSKGYYREIIKFTGGTITFGILISSFFLLNWATAILLIILEFTIVCFVSAFLVEFLTKKRIR